MQNGNICICDFVYVSFKISVQLLTILSKYILRVLEVYAHFGKVMSMPINRGALVNGFQLLCIFFKWGVNRGDRNIEMIFIYFLFLIPWFIAICCGRKMLLLFYANFMLFPRITSCTKLSYILRHVHVCAGNFNC